MVEQHYTTILEIIIYYIKITAVLCDWHGGSVDNMLTQIINLPI
jgi:hypothetical protein